MNPLLPCAAEGAARFPRLKRSCLQFGTDQEEAGRPLICESGLVKCRRDGDRRGSDLRHTAGLL